VSCSAVEFPDGLGDGEACGRNADEGGPYGLAGQFGDAARVVVFLEVSKGCGLGDRDGVGLAGLPGGDLVAAPAAGEAVDQDGVEVPGLVPEPGVDGQRPACPGDEAPGGEVVDAEEGDVAFARGGAEVPAGAPFDDPGGEPGVFQGGGCQAGLADAVGSFGCQDAGAAVGGRGRCPAGQPRCWRGRRREGRRSPRRWPGRGGRVGLRRPCRVRQPRAVSARASSARASAAAARWSASWAACRCCSACSRAWSRSASAARTRVSASARAWLASSWACRSVSAIRVSAALTAASASAWARWTPGGAFPGWLVLKSRGSILQQWNGQWR